MSDQPLPTSPEQNLQPAPTSPVPQQEKIAPQDTRNPGTPESQVMVARPVRMNATSVIVEIDMRIVSANGVQRSHFFNVSLDSILSAPSIVTASATWTRNFNITKEEIGRAMEAFLFHHFSGKIKPFDSDAIDIDESEPKPRGFFNQR